MKFVIYGDDDYKENDVIEIYTSEEKYIKIHTEIENNLYSGILYGIVTKVRDNKSVEGYLVNGIAIYPQPILTNMGPYTVGNKTNFMWASNSKSKITKEFLKEKYPEAFLI